MVYVFIVSYLGLTKSLTNIKLFSQLFKNRLKKNRFLFEFSFFGEHFAPISRNFTTFDTKLNQ